MTRKGNLFVISGPSGVGKGTIKDGLLARMKDIKLSISVTTRQPRQGEIDGQDYFFVNDQEFQLMVENGQFLEHARVYSGRYGTPGEYVTENIKKGQDVLLEIDIQGALQVREKMPQGVFIFIAPPSFNVLAARLCNRGKDSRESIEKRLKAYDEEMQHLKDYDYVVVNDRLRTAVTQVKSIVIAERCKVRNMDLEVI